MRHILIAFLLASGYLAICQDPRTASFRIPNENVFSLANQKGDVFLSSEPCEQSYLSFKLTGFDIAKKKDKDFWGKYSPIIVVVITIGEEDIVKVIKTQSINKDDGTKTARSVVNTLLFGPQPYNGDKVTLKINLYAYKIEDNQMWKTIDALIGLSNLFPNNISQAIEVSKQIKNVVEGLFTANDKGLLSYEKTWYPKTGESTSSPLEKGFFIITAENSGISAGKEIEIKKGPKVRWKASGEALYERNINYAVVEFEHFIKRPDIANFSHFYKYFEQATIALASATNKGEYADAESQYLKFRKGLLNDINFTSYDKRYQDIKHFVVFSNDHPEKPSFKAMKQIPGCQQEDNPKAALFKAELRSEFINSGLIKSNEVVSMEDLGEMFEELSSEQRFAFYERNASLGFFKDSKVEPVLAQFGIDTFEDDQNNEEFVLLALVKRIELLLELEELERNSAIKRLLENGTIHNANVEDIKSRLNERQLVMFKKAITT